MLHLKIRRGATMVIVGVALVALVGIMAFSLDFGRMYLFRAQVHVSADAATLAGAERLAKQAYLTAASTAVTYGQANLVENAVPTISTGDIVPGVWNFTTSTFVDASGGSWTATGNNAVKATSRYTANYSFGRIFGFTTRLRSATSIAAVGSVGGTECVRPWAVPYQMMLDALYPPAGTKNALTYNLTSQDVTTLSALTIANNMYLKIGNATSGIVPGNFFGVRLPPHEYADGTQGNPWPGGNTYRNAVGWTCAQLSAAVAGRTTRPYVGVGDWLAPENGDMEGPTGQGLATLCQTPGNGGTTPPNASGNASFRCNTPVPIKIAIWSVYGNAPKYPSGCGGKCFQVKYLGVFAVREFDTTNGVRGYFSSLVSAGQFTGAPGPIKKIALVR